MSKKQERWKNVGTMPLCGDVGGAKTIEVGGEMRPQDFSDWDGAKDVYLGMGIIEKIGG